MRVLFVIDKLVVGGAELSLMQIASRLSGCEVLVVHPYAGQELLSSFNQRSFDVQCLGFSGVKNELVRVVPKLMKVVSSFSPDVVNSTLPRSRFACRAATRIARVAHLETFVSDMYGEARMQTRSARERRHWHRVKLFDRVTARAFERGVAVSEEIKRCVCRDLWVKPSRIEVLPCGQESALFSGHDREQVRAELGVPRDAPMVMAVARLSPAKGFDVLLRALAHAHRSRPDLQLVIVGGGELDRELRQQAARLGVDRRVLFLGTRFDVPRLLGAADVFASPSRSEGFGIALLEAMMSGLPIVASDIAPTRDLVTHGVSALLSPVGDAEALARNLLGVVSDPGRSAELGRAARVAAESYDIEVVARRFRQLLESCAGR